jgi:hypothetical protein
MLRATKSITIGDVYEEARRTVSSLKTRNIIFVGDAPDIFGHGFQQGIASD